MVDFTTFRVICTGDGGLFFNVSLPLEVVGFGRPGLQIFLDTGIGLGFKDSMNGDFPAEPRTRRVGSVNRFTCGDARLSGVHGNIKGVIIASGCSTNAEQWH